MKSKPSSLIGSLFLLLAFAGAVQADSAPREAPDFSAPDFSGKVQTLSSYRGRIVILNFWATWCQECVRELPSLSAFAEANKDIVVLGVASERNPETIANFLSSSPVKYPMIVDATGDIFVKKYRIRALPCTVIVDRKGFVSERIFGAENFQSTGFREKIQRLKEAK
jgi:thiol-disulfide isomerase/thioredoxin